MSNRKTPHTVVEVIEERPGDLENTPMVKVTHVLINGQPVTVARHGIHIDYDHNLQGSERTLRDGLVAVTVELLVDEFHVKKVPTGYTEGKTSTSTGPHVQWSAGVAMEDGKGTPVTTKIEQQRDHLGRFTKRK